MKKRWDPDWVCPLCNTLIFGRHAACKKCKTPKLKPGDWVCRRAPCVQEFNFGKNAVCRRCQQPKPTHCVCTDPWFRSLEINGNTEELLGPCAKCLCPNPQPWYEVFLDRQEASLKQDIPRHYRLDLFGRNHNNDKSLTGYGKLVPMHANCWLFESREHVVAELEALKGKCSSLHVIADDDAGGQ